jgi:hypothetical protein
MADRLSAMRELRYLDEKRLLGPLAPAEELRWEELRALISPQTAPSAPATAIPLPSPQTAQAPSQPQAPSFVSYVAPASQATEVEPPFVDAELTEDAVAPPPQEPSEGPALSAFDKPPIPQAPLGQEPMLLDFQRPTTDFEPTQVGEVEQRPSTDFEQTRVVDAEPRPASDYEPTRVAEVEPPPVADFDPIRVLELEPRPSSDFDQTMVAPIPLSSMAPAPAPEPEEPMMEGVQPLALEPGDQEADTTSPPEASPPLETQPPIAPDQTAVIPPSAVPWRVTTSPGLDPAEAEFFREFEEKRSAAPSASVPTPPPATHGDVLNSWPRPQAVPTPSPEVPALAPEPSPLGPPPETVVAPYVSGMQRVVVHTLEGLQTRGFLTETDLTRGAILLKKVDGGEQWFNVEELKAVFFLVAPDQKPSPAQGTRVGVTLRDGRNLHGTALDPSGQGVGFFLFPEEGNARVDRIFIYLQAVKDIAPV